MTESTFFLAMDRKSTDSEKAVKQELDSLVWVKLDELYIKYPDIRPPKMLCTIVGLPSSDCRVCLMFVGIGNDGTGKTCLVKHFCEKKFTKTYHSTVGVDYGFKLHKIRGKDYRVNFWDFGGGPEYNLIRMELYNQSHGGILVYDVTNRYSFECLEQWLEEFHKYGGKGAVLGLVGNKIDLSTRNRAVTSNEGQAWARAHGMRYFESSAATGQGVQELFTELLSLTVDKMPRKR